MAQNDRDFCTLYIVPLYIFRYFLQRHGVMRLFDGIDGVPFGLQGLDSVQGLFVITPSDALFGTECSLMDLLVRRTTTDAAEHDPLDTHRVGGTEDGTYVMLTAHVIEYHHQR